MITVHQIKISMHSVFFRTYIEIINSFIFYLFSKIWRAEKFMRVIRNRILQKIYIYIYILTNYEPNLLQVLTKYLLKCYASRSRIDMDKEYVT